MAGPQKKQDGKKVSRPDGQLRQSQLVTTFGPGAMVDLVDRAVVIGGLEHWGFGTGLLRRSRLSNSPDSLSSLDCHAHVAVDVIGDSNLRMSQLSGGPAPSA